MILGGPKGEASASAVEEVMEQSGFRGPCAPVLRAQGEGIWIVLLEIGPKAFIGGIAGAAGVDAWRRLKGLMGQLREALGQPEGSHGQLYIRPDVVSDEEWEASQRQGPMPGSPKPGTERDELIIDTLWTDDDYRAVFEPKPYPEGQRRRPWRRKPEVTIAPSFPEWEEHPEDYEEWIAEAKPLGVRAELHKHRAIPSGADLPEFVPIGLAVYVATKLTDKTLDALIDLLKRVVIDRASTRWWTKGKTVKGVIYGPDNEVLKEVTWTSKDGERRDRDASA